MSTDPRPVPFDSLPPHLLDLLACDLAAVYVFDPYDLSDEPPESLHLLNCGGGRAHTYSSERFEAHVTMCQELRCLSRVCSKWRIDGAGNKQSIRQMYDAMPEPIFDSAAAVYLQPFADGSSELAAALKRAQRSRGRWTRVQAFTRTWPNVSFLFSEQDVSRPSDRWHSWRLTPDDARAFLFDVLLQPGVLAHKPTAAKRCGWDLPPDPPRVPGTRMRVGGSDASVSDRIIDLADDKARTRRKRVRAVGGVYAIPPVIEREIAVAAYAAARDEVLSEVSTKPV